MTKAQKQSTGSPLSVSVHLRGAFDGDFEAFAERRVRYAFARFGSSVRRIRVDLTQNNEGETFCRLQLHGTAQRPVVVVESELVAPLALRSALAEAARQVARSLRRGRTLVHLGPSE